MEVFATSFVQLTEEMGREPDVFAHISEDVDGDTTELIDAMVDVDVVFCRCGWINTTFLW